MSSASTSTAATPATTTTSSSATDDSQIRVVNLDIYSDTVCPFCFIGYRRLQKAFRILDSSKVRIELNWLPFFLDSSLPDESVSKLARYISKFGNEKAEQMQLNMSKIGNEEGINFKFGGQIGSTLHSHRLSEYARRQGRQSQVVDLLFQYYFELEKDISHIPTLIECANQVGLTGNVEAFLNSDECVDEILELVESAVDRGVSGVPNITIDDKFEIRGAQSTKYFETAFQKIGLPLNDEAKAAIAQSSTAAAAEKAAQQSTATPELSTIKPQ